MEFWRVGDLIKRGIFTFTGGRGMVIGLCFTLGIESTTLGHAKTLQPHIEPVLRVVSLGEPPRSNYVYSAAASAVSLGDLGVILSAAQW